MPLGCQVLMLMDLFVGGSPGPWGYVIAPWLRTGRMVYTRRAPVPISFLSAALITSRKALSRYSQKNWDGTSTVRVESWRDTGVILLNQISNWRGSTTCEMKRRQLFQVSICRPFNSMCLCDDGAKLVKKIV